MLMVSTPLAQCLCRASSLRLLTVGRAAALGRSRPQNFDVWAFGLGSLWF